MKDIIIFICSLAIVLTGSVCHAQTKAKISKPRLELEDNQINIRYDILNSLETDIFRIWIEITDSTGNYLPALSLSGDIGDDVKGGNDKMITWDYASDNIYPEAGIYVQINAELLTTVEATDIILQDKKISRAAVIGQSMVFPGWGLSRVNKGKPHWIKGLAGYGCIAASVVYNRKAVTSYEDYEDTSDFSERNEFYNNSVREDNLSELFAYAAAGIWIMDLIWTVAGSSKLNRGPNYGQAGRISVYPVYEPSMRAQMVTVTYTF
ncbi:MAG: hypothetical protein JW965_02165 [Bacteroidales bacterium]|nr:hypothetical protein [Bacteroidales bacterium]